MLHDRPGNDLVQVLPRQVEMDDRAIGTHQHVGRNIGHSIGFNVIVTACPLTSSASGHYDPRGTAECWA